MFIVLIYIYIYIDFQFLISIFNFGLIFNLIFVLIFNSNFHLRIAQHPQSSLRTAK